jgi:hypothetical protein
LFPFFFWDDDDEDDDLSSHQDTFRAGGRDILLGGAVEVRNIVITMIITCSNLHKLEYNPYDYDIMVIYPLLSRTAPPSLEGV